MLGPTAQPITTIDLPVAEAVVRGLKAQSPTPSFHNALDKAVRQLRRGIVFELTGNHLRVQSSRNPDVLYDTDLDLCDCEACLLYHTFCWHRGLLMVLLAIQLMGASVRAVLASPCPPSPFARRAPRRGAVQHDRRAQPVRARGGAAYLNPPAA
ncbi:MAG TPA: hypothetical protein VFZ66_27475 [Herpetosiphonaceae bacterium]